MAGSIGPVRVEAGERLMAPTMSRVPTDPSTALRPQSVLLLLAALAPFDGLLLIIPHPAAFEGWKEALVFLAAGLAILERPARPSLPQLPPWAVPMILLVIWSAFSVALNPTFQAVLGFKISYFYALVPLVLWWSPLGPRDRDRLVTILMVSGVVTSVVGIIQQVVGEEALNKLGYEYNEVIRSSGGFLRSFSTFNQPFPFAFFVMVVILVGIPVALEDRARTRNRLFLLALPVLLVGMTTAIVRGAFLGLAVGLVYLGVTRYRVLAHALLPLPLVVLFLFTNNIGSALLSSSSLQERVTGWVSEVGGQSIAPLGQGIGSTGSAAERIESQGVAVGETGGRYQADNYYVKTLIELGPIGLWLLLWVLVAAGRHTHRGPPVLLSISDGGLVRGVTASIGAAVVAATVATYWEIFPVDLYFWFLLGVASSIRVRSS